MNRSLTSMSQELQFSFRKVKGCLGHFGEVVLIIDHLQPGEASIVEAYNGNGYAPQGYALTIPEKGFDDWKSAIRSGIEYAFKRLDDQRIRVTVKEATGLLTDTNSAILAYAASRALLGTLSNSETETEKIRFEELVLSSYNYEDNAQLDIEDLQLVGQLRSKSPYRFDTNG